MELRWLPSARSDVRAIMRFIHQHDPAAATRWARRIHAAAHRAAEMPYSGRRIPEFDRDDARETIVGNYRVLYRIHGSEVRVIAVMHGRRLLPPEIESSHEP